MKLEDVYCFARLPRDYKDFWKLNQELTHIDPFRDFVDKDKSSEIMCCIYMLYDPKSKQQNSDIPFEQQKKDVSSDLLGDENFPWAEYNKYIRAYRRCCKTKIEKELDAWYQDIQERREFTKEVSWDDDPELREKFLGNNKKHFEDYKEIEDRLKEERQDFLMHGDYTPTMLEASYLETS